MPSKVKGRRANPKAAKHARREKHAHRYNTEYLKPEETQFTRDQLEAILGLIEEGADLSTACAITHVAVAAINKAVLADIEIASLFEEAMAKFKMCHIRRVNTGEKQWQSSAWMLAKRFNHEYGESPLQLDTERVIRVRRIPSRPAQPMLEGQVVDASDKPSSQPAVEGPRSDEPEVIEQGQPTQPKMRAVAG